MPGIVKSVSMTTLVMTGTLEPSNGAYGEADNYNVDGICLENLVSKNTQPEQTATNEFGFHCATQASSVSTSWSSATPKIKKGIHQSVKANWHPVKSALSRCCSWDGCSSVDSSSRWRLAPFGSLKRLICCASNFSSDDGLSCHSFVSFAKFCL